MQGELLIDSMPLTMTLEESGKGSGKFIFRGQFARSDKATENKRLYREHLWRRELARLDESMTSRSMFGELDHPQDGRTKLARVSHLITSLTVNGNDIVGEAEVLDTPNGQILKALAECGAKVGVSSRGYGSTKTLPDGTLEVQEDFRLDTFDFVADPATKTAYPQVFREHLEHIPADGALTPQDLQEHYRGLVDLHQQKYGDAPSSKALIEVEQRTEKRLRDRFAIELRRATEVMHEEARASVRSELMSDPDVAGARQVIENIVTMVKSYGFDPEATEELFGKDKSITELERKLADRELEVQKAQQEAKEYKSLAREAALTLHMERILRDDPSREAVEAIIGKVTQYASKEELTDKVKTVREELTRRGGAPPKRANEELTDKVTELEANLELAKADLAKAESKASQATERGDKMEKGARTALKVAEDLEQKLHLEGKLHGMSKTDRTKVRSLCEDAGTPEEITSIVEGYSPVESGVDPDEAERIAAHVGRGKPQNLHEDKGRDGKVKPLQEGMLTEVGGPNISGFNKLAGTGR